MTQNKLVAACQKYLAIFKIQIINSAAYPLDLATRSITMILFMYIFASLWDATYRAMGQTAIAGLSLRDTLWYLMIAETIVLSKPRLAHTIAESVKDGSIAYLLNKPYNFLLYHFSVAFGDGTLRLVFNAIAGGAIVWLMVGPPPELIGIPLVLIAVAGAWVIDCTMTALVGLTAFITEDVAAFDWIYSKLILILGGTLIPLDFFPDWLRGLVTALPFAYTVYAPARFFVAPDLARLALLLAGQGFWIAILALILTIVFQRGMTRLTINGG